MARDPLRPGLTPAAIAPDRTCGSARRGSRPPPAAGASPASCSDVDNSSARPLAIVRRLRDACPVAIMSLFRVFCTVVADDADAADRVVGDSAMVEGVPAGCEAAVLINIIRRQDSSVALLGSTTRRVKIFLDEAMLRPLSGKEPVPRSGGAADTTDVFLHLLGREFYTGLVNAAAGFLLARLCPPPPRRALTCTPSIAPAPAPFRITRSCCPCC